MVRTIIFSKKYVRELYLSFHSYRVVFCAPIPTGPRTPNFGSCSMSYIVFKLHGKGIRGSQALSIAYRDECQMNLFLYGPSRHVEHVWAKFPQFHRRLVGWAGATEPPAQNKSMRT